MVWSRVWLGKSVIWGAYVLQIFLCGEKMWGECSAVSMDVVILVLSLWSNCVYYGANQFIA